MLLNINDFFIVKFGYYEIGICMYNRDTGTIKFYATKPGKFIKFTSFETIDLSNKDRKKETVYYMVNDLTIDESTKYYKDKLSILQKNATHNNKNNTHGTRKHNTDLINESLDKKEDAITKYHDETYKDDNTYINITVDKIFPLPAHINDNGLQIKKITSQIITQKKQFIFSGHNEQNTSVTLHIIFEHEEYTEFFRKMYEKRRPPKVITPPQTITQLKEEKNIEHLQPHDADDIDYILCKKQTKKPLVIGLGFTSNWETRIMRINWTRNTIHYYGNDTHYEYINDYLFPVADISFNINYDNIQTTDKKDEWLNLEYVRPDCKLNCAFISGPSSKDLTMKRIHFYFIKDQVINFIELLNKQHIISVCNLSVVSDAILPVVPGAILPVVPGAILPVVPDAVVVNNPFINYIIKIGLVENEDEFKKLIECMHSSYFQTNTSWETKIRDKISWLSIITNSIVVVNDKSKNIKIKKSNECEADPKLCYSYILQDAEEYTTSTDIPTVIPTVDIAFTDDNIEGIFNIKLVKETNCGGANCFIMKDIKNIDGKMHKYGLRYSFKFYSMSGYGLTNMCNIITEFINTAILSYKFSTINRDENTNKYMPHIHKIVKIGFIKFTITEEQAKSLEDANVIADRTVYMPYIITVNYENKDILKYITIISSTEADTSTHSNARQELKTIEGVDTTSSETDLQPQDAYIDIKAFIFRLLINIMYFLLYVYTEFNFIHGDFKLNNMVINTDAPYNIYIIDFEYTSINFIYDNKVYYLCRRHEYYNNAITTEGVESRDYTNYVKNFILRYTYIDYDIYYVLSYLQSKITTDLELSNSQKPKNKAIVSVSIYENEQTYLNNIFNKFYLLILKIDNQWNADLAHQDNFLYEFLYTNIKERKINYDKVNLLFITLYQLYMSINANDTQKTADNVFKTIKIFRDKDTHSHTNTTISLKDFWVKTLITNFVESSINDIIENTDTFSKNNKTNSFKKFFINKNPFNLTKTGGGNRTKQSKHNRVHRIHYKTKKNNKTFKNQLYKKYNNNSTSKHNSNTMYSKINIKINNNNTTSKQKQKRKYKHTYKH